MPPASETAGCAFHKSTELHLHPYMVQSLARQLATLRACYDAMVGYEASAGVTFEWALRTRTDTGFVAPVPSHCHVAPDGVTLSHAYTKGPNTRFMFADHAAVVPRRRWASFFLSVGDQLRDCAARRRRLPLSYGSPESFIHYAILANGTSSVAEAEIAPYVLSVDGRMPKWCDRYRKAGVPAFQGFNSSAACARHFTGEAASRTWIGHGSAALRACHYGQDFGRYWGRSARSHHLHTRSLPRPRPHTQAITRPAVPPGTRAVATPRLGAREDSHDACTWESGCCKRHPRIPSCARSAPGRR